MLFEIRECFVRANICTNLNHYRIHLLFSKYRKLPIITIYFNLFLLLTLLSFNLNYSKQVVPGFVHGIYFKAGAFPSGAPTYSMGRPKQGILKGDHCTVDLLFDWFGIICMTTDNFCFYLPAD